MTDQPTDDPRIDELFTLEPSDFTAARNALVRELRSEQRRELATAVSGMRRPTAAAWAVNRTVRGHRDRFDQLVAAGEAVRTAQRRALSGVKRGGMREATRARRDLIEQLADQALAILTAHGVAADSHRGDIVATFDAASADADAADAVGAARLSHALPVSSAFSALEGLTMLSGAGTAAPDAPVTDDPAGEDAAHDDAEAAREQEAALARRTAMRRVSDARRALTEAQDVAERAAAEAKRAEARHDGADRAAATAEDKARRLRDEAAELAQRAERARSRVTETAAEAGRAAEDLRTREGELQALD